jgi:hypothetical protein
MKTATLSLIITAALVLFGCDNKQQNHTPGKYSSAEVLSSNPNAESEYDKFSDPVKKPFYANDPVITSAPPKPHWATLEQAKRMAAEIGGVAVIDPETGLPLIATPEEAAEIIRKERTRTAGKQTTGVIVIDPPAIRPDTGPLINDIGREQRQSLQRLQRQQEIQNREFERQLAINQAESDRWYEQSQARFRAEQEHQDALQLQDSLNNIDHELWLQEFRHRRP